MERLKERLEIGEKALMSLQEILQVSNPDLVTRDAAIQRFEYTFEAIWKAAQRYLSVKEGLSIGSPKGVIRSCFQVGIFNEKECEIALSMTDDRNLTVHTYDETVAQTIYSHLLDYLPIFQNWTERMKKRI